MNIALIGMMGTMKTSVGKALAAMTGMTFTDSDDEFVREEGNTIANAFETKGEEYFRACETEIIKRLAAADGAVISCGGGVPLRKENTEALRATSVVVLLTATPERILERTSGDNSRPLLGDGGIERIKELCAKREACYKNASDFEVDTTDLIPDDVARIIIRTCALNKKNKNL